MGCSRKIEKAGVAEVWVTRDKEVGAEAGDERGSMRDLKIIIWC